MTTKIAAGWRKSAGDFLIWWLSAVLLALITWWPLVRGAGLIGGDIYTYFFPLKMWYWWSLKQGTIPLWNPLIGHGFPILGESQTGALYPFNLLLYSLLPLNDAYNASFLLHYVLAFGFTCQFAHAMGANRIGALFAALVFVYGWFPARSCLEWAAVTGAWIPALLWSGLRYLESGRTRYLLVAQFVFALQLLAGHYHLAFINLIACSFLCFSHGRRLRPLGFLLALILGAFLASPQLLSTWELKQRSHRSEPVFLEKEISYGRIPLEYLPQFLVPWRYYPKMRDDAWRTEFFGKYYTNQAEAHLYFGMVPLVLALLAPALRPRRKVVAFALLSIASGLVLATGALIPVLKYVPGFSYFTGPGRYGMLAQLGVALLAAHTVTWIATRVPGTLHVGFLAILLFVATWIDLWWVATLVQIARVAPDPPVSHLARNESPLQHYLPRMCRVLGKSENALTLLGVSQLPAYIGLSPREYLDDVGAIPFRWNKPPDERVLRWLRWAGVEYIIHTEPLPFITQWPADIAWYLPDPFVAPLLGVGRASVIRVYRLRNAWGRCYTIPADFPLDQFSPYGKLPADVESVTDYEATPSGFVIRVELHEPRILVLADLAYPGWSVKVDGNPADPLKVSIFRAVALPPGKHLVTWSYYPTHLNLGLAAACAVLLVDAAAVVAAFLSGLRKRMAPLKPDAPAAVDAPLNTTPVETSLN